MTRRDVRPHPRSMSPVDRRNDSRHTVRSGIALGIAFELPTSISRAFASLFLAIFPNVPSTWKIDSRKRNLYVISRPSFVRTVLVTVWYMSYAKILRLYLRLTNCIVMHQQFANLGRFKVKIPLWNKIFITVYYFIIWWRTVYFFITFPFRINESR